MENRGTAAYQMARRLDTPDAWHPGTILEASYPLHHPSNREREFAPVAECPSRLLKRAPVNGAGPAPRRILNEPAGGQEGRKGTRRFFFLFLNRGVIAVFIY